MKTLARQALGTTFSRGNRPLGASTSMLAPSGVTGLTTTGIQEWLSRLLGTGSQPGGLLEQYTETVPVYRGVRLRADAVARAPMKVYLTNDAGEMEWAGPNHPVQKLLDAVNPWWSHADMWRAVETYMSLYGSSFRWVNRAGSDPANWEVWVLRPDKVAVVKDRRNYIKGFVYEPGGANFPMMPDEVLWDRYFNPLDEFSGLSPLKPLQEMLGMLRDMIRTNRNLFKNGILAQNLAFMMKGPLTTDQVEQFYKRLEERHATPENANKPIIVDVGTGKVETLGFSNREMEWMLGLKWVKGEVLADLGIPEEMYPGAEHTTFHNRGEARRDFYQHTIGGEWELLEAGMQERFVPMLSDAYRNVVLKFETAVVEGMQETIDAKSQRLLNEVKGGTLSPDEYRKEFGRAPFPDRIGEKPYVPSGTVPLAQLGEGEEAPAPAQDPPQPPPPAAADEDEEEEGRTAQVRALFAEQRKAVIAAARANHRKLEAGVVFDAEAWTARHPWAKDLNEGTARLIAEELSEAKALDEKLTPVLARLEKVFDFSDALRVTPPPAQPLLPEATGAHRCPNCRKLLGKGGEVTLRWCARCKDEVRA